MNKKRFFISPLISLFFLLIIVGVVWAQAPGPNRTTTTTVWRRKHCSYRASDSGYFCTLDLYYTPSSSCPSASATEPWFNAGRCGWPFDCDISAGCSIVVTHPSPNPPVSCSPPSTGCTEVTQTTTLPEATVNGSFTCGLAGSNGWCVGGAGIDLSANEPLAGEMITLIEGDPGVMCDPPNASSISCSWSGGSEGNYSIGFWAMSTYGDSSVEEFVNWRLDTVPPTTGYSVSGGTAGSGGWYRGGPLTITASGSDATSGVPSGGAEVSIGGGGYAPTGTISSEGWYSLDLMATDRAGHTSSSSAGAGLDNTPPVINPGITGTAGSGVWYTSATVTGTESGSDALSGIGSRQYQIDGGAWQSGGSATVTGEGAHTINWQVTDVAGNTSTDSQSFSIDSVEPVSVFVSPAEGTTVTINGNLNMSGTSADATSGLNAAQISLNGGSSWSGIGLAGGAWNYSWDTRTVPNGTYNVLVRASDVAGNLESTAHITVVVDNEGPHVNITALWMVWETASVSVRDAGIGISSARLVIDGGVYGSQRIDWSSGNIPNRFTWDRHFGSVLAPPGEYTVTLVAWDQLGNSGSDSGVVVVPEPPTATPTFEQTSTPTSTAEPVKTGSKPTATPAEVAMVIEPEAAEPAEPENVEIPLPPVPYIWWPLTVIVGLAVILGITGLYDPRPKAWRRLGEIRNEAFLAEEARDKLEGYQ